MRVRTTQHTRTSGQWRLRRAVGASSAALLLSTVIAPYAGAGELNVGGVVVTWDANAFVPPARGVANCSPFTMTWANNSGRDLLQIGVTITNDGSATWTPSNSVYFPWPPIGVKAGTSGLFDRLNEICSIRLTNGLGPYTVVVTVEDYGGAEQTLTAPITFLSEPAAAPPPAAGVEAPSSPADEPATRPSRPRAVKVSVRDSSARLSWAAPDRTEDTMFIVTARPGGARCSTRELQCSFAGLDRGTRYQFDVVARSEGGTSAPARSRRVLIPAAKAPAPRPTSQPTSRPAPPPAPRPDPKPQQQIG